jgi:hypothetical protein
VYLHGSADEAGGHQGACVVKVDFKDVRIKLYILIIF